MSLSTDLLHIVEQAHSLERILEAAARAIAERLHAERCHVLLHDERGELAEPGFGHGPPSEHDRDEAREAAAAAAQAIAERRATTFRGARASLLAAPMFVRDRVLGALVLRRAAGTPYSAEALATLETVAAQLVGIVENARIIGALDRGERPAPLVARPSHGAPERGERSLQGVGASPGVAIGPAVFRGAYRLDLSALELPAGDAGAERARVRSAFEKTHDDVSRIQRAAAREIDEEHALIFASHLMMLGDPALRERIDEQIGRGLSAPLAIDAALEEYEARLSLVADAYIRERMDDVDDLRGRLLDHALGGRRHAHLGASVVLTSRIPPSLVIELKTEGARALVTESGGSTSHGVLLARAMGIPVVTGIADLIASARPGDQVIVDGTSGAVVLRPGEAALARAEAERRQAEQARTEHARFRDRLACTADGVRVTLQANVGVASDLAVARENGAEGIGLYRTEFPFIVRDAFPTRAEQARIYGRAYEAFPDGPIHFRILDLAGDKFVAGGQVAAARGPFHGYRSIRVLFDHPDVLRDQVQAFALAAGERPLRILIPMVTSIEELHRVKALVREALAQLEEPRAQRAPEIGVMIEVPAAVELAADLAREADFLSIGTNDLMQYTLVVDREDSRMAAIGDPYHPAILRMIARVVAAARQAGRPVGVCGEVAARPDVALALMALGVDSLSVVPTAIPELKQALAAARLEPMRRDIRAILALSDAASVAAALRQARGG
ncbi:MAG TPA: phosphoenolpyruvate--protein phosphotransferase [Anaeromyxobacteraceae bacterium]|nr:phosphoenolpyruvate--protein phosphotransferase [Anaeromyxobacteraceae bacterium]